VNWMAELFYLRRQLLTSMTTSSSSAADDCAMCEIHCYWNGNERKEETDQRRRSFHYQQWSDETKMERWFAMSLLPSNILQGLMWILIVHDIFIYTFRGGSIWRWILFQKKSIRRWMLICFTERPVCVSLFLILFQQRINEDNTDDFLMIFSDQRCEIRQRRDRLSS
jgi:hypothetical protein